MRMLSIPALCLLLLFSVADTRAAAGFFDFNLPSLEQLLEKASLFPQDERSEAHKLYVRAREMETSTSHPTQEEEAGITAIYLEAANAGHWKAKAHMVYRYANGIGIKRNILLAADLAKELAKEGTSGGLDILTKSGSDTVRDEEKKDEPMHATAEASPLSAPAEGDFPDSPAPKRQGSPVFVDHAVTAPGLTPVRVDGKYGYITSQGEWGISPRYDAANPFSANGLAWVQYQGRYGVVNTAGEWILPAEIDRIGQFSADGLAQASKDGMVGFVDTAGTWAVPPEYHAVSDFAENGLARVSLRPKNLLMHELSKGPKGLIDIVYRDFYGTSSLVKLWGFVDKKGNRIIPVELHGASNFGPNGLAAARKKASVIDNAWGYIDASGNWVIAPEFFSASIFNESGTAFVDRSATEPAGLIDQTGTFLIEPDYHIGTMFTLLAEEPGADGGVKRTAVLPFMHKKKWGAIGLDGRWTVEPKLEALSLFNDDGLAIAMAEGKCGIINAKGNWIFQPVYVNIRPFVRDELAIAVGENGKMGVVNRKGDWILKPEIDTIRPIITIDGIDTHTRFGRIDRQGRRGYSHFDGRWRVTYLNGYEAADGEKAYLASKAAAAVWPALAVVDGKYGYISSQGQWAVKPTLDDAKPFNANGLASVKKGGKYGLMDANGAWVCPPKFDEIGYHNNGQFSSYGLAIAKVDGKVGYIGIKGTWAIQPYLEYCHDFQDCGLAWARTQKGPDGILDARGNWVVSPGDYTIQHVYASAGVIKVYENSKYGMLSLSGETIFPLQFDALNHLDGSDFFYVEQNGLSGVIDKRGYWVIRPCFKAVEEYIETTVEMEALTSFNSKYFLGRSGNLIVPVGERFSEAATPLKREIQKDRHVLVNGQGESVLTIILSPEGDRAINSQGEIIWPLSKNE